MEPENEEQIIEFLERLKLDTHINEDEVTSICAKLVEACHVPRLNRAEDVPYTASDFTGIAENAESYLCAICRMLEGLCSVRTKGQKFSSLILKSVIVNCLLVASEYTDCYLEWSNDKTALAAKNAIEKVCELVNCHSLNDLFSKQNSAESNTSQNEIDYLEHILQKLIQTLNKKTWKAFPASKASYFAIVMVLDQKCLGNHLSYLLPPALFIIDDWEPKNKVLGLKCLQHILQNTPGSEIRWYGRAAVIFDALKPHLHSREVVILEVLYPTIITAAAIMESDPANTRHLRSMSSYDEVMQPLILNMRYEQNLALRAVYASAIPLILKAMGILAIKWSVEVIPMCEDYLATYSDRTSVDRLNILKALQIYIQECWPQIHMNVSSILKMILRLIYDITDKDADLEHEVAERLVSESICVITLLFEAAPKTTKELLNEVVSAEVHPECRTLLRRIENIVSSTAVSNTA